MANHLGTPTQMYDEEGEQVWERSLDLNGKVINGSNAPCPFLYQGQY
ncbi:RHS domain-containing protein, partial [Tenacibaculum maritimum]